MALKIPHTHIVIIFCQGQQLCFITKIPVLGIKRSFLTLLYSPYWCISNYISKTWIFIWIIEVNLPYNLFSRSVHIIKLLKVYLLCQPSAVTSIIIPTYRTRWWSLGSAINQLISQFWASNLLIVTSSIELD